MSPDDLEHPKATVPSKPFTGKTVTLKFVEPAGDTVALVGLTEALKPHTCSCAMAVCVRGGLTPVIAIW